VSLSESAHRTIVPFFLYKPLFHTQWKRVALFNQYSTWLKKPSIKHHARPESVTLVPRPRPISSLKLDLLGFLSDFGLRNFADETDGLLLVLSIIAAAFSNYILVEGLSLRVASCDWMMDFI